MLTEAICRIVRIQPESKNIKWYSVLALEAFTKTDKLFHRTKYEGTSLPTEGATLLVSNHREIWDIARGYRMGQRSRRIPRTFAKITLLDPTRKESVKVAERTGNKTDILNSAGSIGIRWAKQWIRHRIADVCKGAEAQPLVRGGSEKNTEDFKERAKVILKAKQIVGCFVQETRNKDGKLRNPKPGVAWLAEENPDILIFPMGISKKRVSIGEPFTYNQMRKDPKYAALTKRNFLVVICDKIADQLDPEERNDWYEVQRPSVLSRPLVSSRRNAPSKMPITP